MEHAELTRKIDAYLEENWETMVEDIETLVRIPSFEESDKATEGAPFGPGPKEALEAALEMASDMGFKTHDAEGYIGFADFPGKSDTQLGIIGHMDVVPAGPGWNFEPYAVTRKEGYLVGRGTLDDKGPSVVALHAMKFWKDLQDAGEAPQFPYTVRFLFGANEESGMADVAYYHKHYDDPAFLFTPDAEFPVCYGEKGGYDGELISKPIADRIVLEFTGGAATNAVPGIAEAVVKADAADLPNTDRITVAADGEGRVKITAAGKGAHASMPEGGVNAIGLIVDYRWSTTCAPPTSARSSSSTRSCSIIPTAAASASRAPTSTSARSPSSAAPSKSRTTASCRRSTVGSPRPSRPTRSPSVCASWRARSAARLRTRCSWSRSS